MMARERRANSVRKKRWEIDARIAAKAARFAEGRLPDYEAKKLVAELSAAGEPKPFPEAKRAKGWREHVEREVAKHYSDHFKKRISARAVREWVDAAHAKPRT